MPCTYMLIVDGDLYLFSFPFLPSPLSNGGHISIIDWFNYKYNQLLIIYLFLSSILFYYYSVLFSSITILFLLLAITITILFYRFPQTTLAHNGDDLCVVCGGDWELRGRIGRREESQRCLAESIRPSRIWSRCHTTWRN